MNVPKEGSWLYIFVENMGRVQTGHTMSTEWKGILNNIQFFGKNQYVWDSFSFDFEDVKKIPFEDGLKNVTNKPVFYKGNFEVIGKPVDTFASFKNWSKGIMWINGFNLGRYWSVGPQERLYVPSHILREGQNELVMLELDRTNTTIVSLESLPQLGLQLHRNKEELKEMSIAMHL